MARTKKFKGWGEQKQTRKGARNSNRVQGAKKRLTTTAGTTISNSKEVIPSVTGQQALLLTGPVFYRCLSDPGDVKQRNPGEGVPYCRYCGFPMVRVGAVGREKRDRM